LPAKLLGVAPPQNEERSDPRRVARQHSAHGWKAGVFAHPVKHGLYLVIGGVTQDNAVTPEFFGGRKGGFVTGGTGGLLDVALGLLDRSVRHLQLDVEPGTVTSDQGLIRLALVSAHVVVDMKNLDRRRPSMPQEPRSE
jgi:hypothetical protein